MKKFANDTHGRHDATRELTQIGRHRKFLVDIARYYTQSQQELSIRRSCRCRVSAYLVEISLSMFSSISQAACMLA
jgi:hypothetical protein